MAPPVSAMLQVIGGNYVTERDSEHYLILSSLVFSFGDDETVIFTPLLFSFFLVFPFSQVTGSSSNLLEITERKWKRK